LQACIESGVEIEALPGPSAVTTALVVSGLPADRVVFLGFPPRKGWEREAVLGRVAREEATFILFESPRRLTNTLKELPTETPVAVCRELTKLHEEVYRGTAEEAADHFSQGVRGEIVLAARGGATEQISGLEEVVEKARGYVVEGASPSRAAARAARESRKKRSEIYDRLVRR
jgi:16S rRNA (cytidine1402-2'-O)-methyltransferase